MTHNLHHLARSVWHPLYAAYCQAWNSPALRTHRETQGTHASPERRIKATVDRLLVPTGLAKAIRATLAPCKAVARVIQISRGGEAPFPVRVRSAWRSLMLDIDHQTWRKNQLWSVEDQQRIDGFLSHEGICALLTHLNEGCDTSFLDNKKNFAEYCRINELPHPELFAVDSDGPLPDSDLFVKYEDGVCGVGAERYRKTSGPICKWIAGGRDFTGQELRSHLESLESKGGLVVQPVLENHPEIEPFSNGSLCTLRVVTHHAPPLAPRVMVCALRMPAGASVVDNFAAGGIAAGVSLDGVVMAGVAKKNPEKLISTHPDSGAVFEGAKLPMFAKATQLCLKAHGLFTRPHFVGWDVAFSLEGPLLLEANSIWCVDVIQMSHRAPIGDFGFYSSYLDCLAKA